MMYRRQEAEYYRAKMKAARRVCRGWVKPADLPSNAEIRDQVELFARTMEGASRRDELQEMRCEALRMMRILYRFRPRLIGSVLTGHIRKGSDIDLHLFSDSVQAVTTILEWEGIRFDTQRKEVRKHNQSRIFHHVHVRDRYPIEMTVYPAQKAHVVFKSSITGKAMERMSIAELEQFLRREYPELDLDQGQLDARSGLDRYQVFEALLLPLEQVRQPPQFHPEGDALYHSLQVFDLAQRALPYDEEFLLAALLHDVGKAIDANDHVASGLQALQGFITPRTTWLIAEHMSAQQLFEGTLGARARRRLEAHESFEELMLLAACDREGRKCGVDVPDVDQALEQIRDVERMCTG
jgi:hypothetical protein